MKVLITTNSFSTASQAPLQKLMDAGFEVTKNPYGRLLTQDEMIDLIQDKDAVILSTDPFTKRVVEHCPKLRVVSRYGVGTDNIDLKALREAGIPLEITKSANSDAVADHTIGLMIDVAHYISYESRMYHDGAFVKVRGRDLGGSKVGIIGLGAIGKRVAKRLKGFDCEVYAFDVCYDEKFVAEQGIIKAIPERIFRECDFITLHIPALPEYQDFVNEAQLRLMQKHAILINAARSELVSKPALLKALKEGWIGGYGADVSFCEPNTDDEFREFKNVVITPHAAPVTVGAVDKMSMAAVDNVLKYFIQETEG